uniref:Ring finger protein 122 n=1 Tax=Capra hircus TaxID=9925 RepID=A0A8C2PGR0_CAPHI
MHPFQWCNGCFCGLGLVSTNKSCSMPPISFQDLPLNIYMVIFGTGIFIFMLSLIFCCYFISKLRNQAQSERYGYKEVKKSSFCPETSPRSTTTSPDRDGRGRWREQGGGKMKLACSPLVPRESEGLPRRSWGLPSSADATWPHVWFLLTPGLPSFFPGGA